MNYRYVTGSDGVVRYATIDGDTVDDIAYGYYGENTNHTEAVLAANPGLAEAGPILPAGMVVIIPAVTSTNTPVPTISLWS
ncbi:P2-like prophage tail protein X [uncultured Pleomorphomonas sp.]|uniref:P2-like prophage tail protein X n=1 Tax=uncultured Pleomorphomonas sp. TaxID=442121 RepID=A0A212LR98_9HYPH|nr:tail protein X [uncultured Pleomorphomonas sp.]SCM80001.1 P2-like prophage tail protein X [uncultured Pleomorphomonas sp.]